MSCKWEGGAGGGDAGEVTQVTPAGGKVVKRKDVSDFKYNRFLFCLQIIKMHSFLDYIMGGCQIQFTVSTHTHTVLSMSDVTMETVTTTTCSAASLSQLAPAALTGMWPVQQFYYIYTWTQISVIIQ